MHKRSKAKAAGVEVGDVLLAINGHTCRHWAIDQAMDTINNSPGREVTLRLLRWATVVWYGIIEFNVPLDTV